MVWANREREAYERYQQEARKANIEAVRKQMNAMPDSTR
jgi:ribosomal protein S21